MRQWIKLLVVAASATFLAACGSDDDNAPAPVNIVETAQADSRFSILVEAVVAADLAGTLSGPGPLTVFAPTNDAFAALLTELGVTKAQLLADKALLTPVLTYHVLPGKVLKADVPAGKAITTVQGGIFKVDVMGSDLVITDGRNRTSKITATDLVATNGVIHVVDKVILPANQNIVETAIAADPEFSILVEAVVAANLQGTLSRHRPVHGVRADQRCVRRAARGARRHARTQLLADMPLLTKVLTYHVVTGRVLKADVPMGTNIPTVQGETFSVDADLNHHRPARPHCRPSSPPTCSPATA